MPLRILQLSDIHFSTRIDDELIEHGDVREELLRDLENEVIPGQGRIDSVLIAGDIAFSGNRQEYEVAAAWLEKVTTICGCKPTDVLTVPGNHDVDRRRVVAATKLIHRRLRTCSLPEAMRELTELMEAKDGMLTDKLLDYQAFAASYGCNFKSASRPHWERQFLLEGHFRLSFLGLTSVQVCDAEDQAGAMLLGKSQYVIDRSPCVEPIVVMHHPFEWLKDRMQAHDYLASRARVLIFGHEHYQQISKVTGTNSDDRLLIGSGAVTPEHAGDPYIYRYNILEFSRIDLNGSPGLEVKVYPRVWVRERTRFDADSGRLGGRTSAAFELRCPQFLLPPPAGAQQSVMHVNVDANFAKLSYLYWRYLDWKTRLRLLITADSLPDVEQPSNVHLVGQLGLVKAKEQLKLRALWDLVMPLVPPEKREPNPF